MAVESRPKSITIDGTTYKIGYLDAEQALDVFHRMAELFLPAMRQVVPPAAMSEAAFLHAVESTFQRWIRGGGGSSDRESVILPLLSVVLVDGVPLDGTWRVHFAGRLLSLYKVLWAAIAHNFADFFDALGDLKALLAALAATMASTATDSSPSA